MADDTHLVNASEMHEHDLLEQTWQPPRGFFRWFTHVHHQSISKRYIITAFVFFLLGGILALLMRLQLAHPEQTLLGPDLYNQIFTIAWQHHDVSVCGSRYGGHGGLSHPAYGRHA
jgi:hypothetical protein